MKKAVVFDLDGTLLNTLEDLMEATNYAISYFGYPKITLEDTKKNIGTGIRNLILKSVGMDETHIEEMMLKFKEYYLCHCNDYTKPYDGIDSVLACLKLKNYKLGCVSNKAKYALSILCDSHFKGIFDVVIGDQEGYKRKPDPEMLIECAKRLGVSMDEMIYVGDSDTDVVTVQNAGCEGIFVSYGFRSEDVLKSLGATRICDVPIEILNKVREL